MTSIFGSVAVEYYTAGLTPLPLGKYSSKSAKAVAIDDWQVYCSTRPSREQIDEWVKRFGDHNVGLAMGTTVGDYVLVGFDIDDENYQEPIERAIGNLVSGKVGAKGATWFALASPELKNRSFRKRNPDNNKFNTILDVLAVGRQAAVPPSIHPNTKKSFKWLGKSLIEINLQDLPIVTDGTLREIAAIVDGRAHYIIGGRINDGGVEMDIDGINNMLWAGVGGGGTTHDNRLRCIGWMVADGWSDDDILTRLDRAMREAWENGEGEEPNWDYIAEEHRKMIESARSKGFGDAAEKKKGRRPLERDIADWLAEKMDPIAFHGSSFFRYKNGHWPKQTVEYIRKGIMDAFPKAKRADISNSMALFADLVFEKDFGTKSKSKICLLNGTLDVESMELGAWESDDQILHQLDVNWEDDSECKVYNEFVDRVFDGDEQSIQCFNEFAGLTLVDDMSFQKMMYLIGPGGNGKSTLTNLLTMMHDPDSVSTVAITALDEERQRTAMVGKLLNISSEQSRLNVISDVYMKQITGGDPISVRKLYAEVDNNVRLKCRLLCLANEMPATNDASVAMQRRLIILECPNVIPEKERDPFFIEKLKGERSGILRKWVEALRTLRERRRFDDPERSRVLVMQYLEDNNVVASWLANRCIRLDTNNEKIEKWSDLNEAYQDLVDYAEACGYRRGLTRGQFKSALSAQGIPVNTIQVDFAGGRLPSEKVPLKFQQSAIANRL